MRVYYQDTDAGGVVFHAQYLAFMERARSELLNARGIDLARFTDRHDCLFVVHHATVKYHLPARVNDMLSVSADVVKRGGASLVFRQRVERGDELLVEGEISVALVDRHRLKPVRMPQELEQALRA